MTRISGNNIQQYLAIASLITIHISWLLVIKSQMNSDVIFPSWLLFNTKNLVSEVITMYPPLLFYTVNFVNVFFNSYFISTTIIQIALVIIIDLLLFYYLTKKFRFKFAIIGLIFYIPWQVFFRGNYLWHDFATIPFIFLSFFFFEKFISKPIYKNLLLASTILAFGYLFKITIIYIFGLYFFWTLYVTQKKAWPLFRNFVILFFPLAFAVFANFLIVLSKSTLAFTFYWNIIMQIFIYPRLPALSRPVSSNYYPVIALLLAVCLLSSFVISKFSGEQNRKKWLLFSFVFVSLFSLFPRWSDFRVQLFLLPLTIACVYAIFLSNKIHGSNKYYFGILSCALIFFSLVFMGNRIIAEWKSTGDSGPNYTAKFAPNNKVSMIENKNVFIYDYALYDDKLPFNSLGKMGLVQQLKLGLTNPDYFHHSTSWQKALEYVNSSSPTVVLIPYQIKNKIDSGTDLTGFENFLLDNYHQEGSVVDYFVYTTNNQDKP